MADAEITATASAPGKLILFGEHSVVYGYAAVAAALSELRVSVHVTATTDGLITAELCDLLSSSPAGGTVKLRMPAKKLRDALADCEDLNDWRSPSPPSEATIQLCRKALDESPVQDSADGEKLLPLVFLCRALLPELLLPTEASAKRQKTTGGGGAATAGLRLSVRSAALPLGAGLGSSAAFSVALAGALLRLRLRLFPDADGAAELQSASSVRGGGGSATAASSSACPCDAAKHLLNGWAYAGECILHGTPSGLDNEVSCAGDAVRFLRDGTQKRFASVRGLPPLRVLITNTKVARSTREKVAGVAALRAAQPDAMTRIFEAIGCIADSFLALAKPTDPAETAAASVPSDAAAAATGAADELSTIGTLVRMNHHLLCALGVGAPALDAVVSVTQEEGLPTKLTGAGGGGCAYTVLGLAEQPLSAEVASAVARARAKLEARGFECFETRVGGHGCLWHE